MRKLNILVRLAVCFLFVFLPLHSLDQWFYDHFFNLRGRHHRDLPLVLVTVNDVKLFQSSTRHKVVPQMDDETDGRKTPSLWVQTFYERLLSHIEKDQPQLVIFGSYFDGTDADVVGPPPFTNVLFSSALDEENKIIPPPEKLLSNENYGFSNIFPDPDNVVRRTNLVYSSNASILLKIYQRLRPGPIRRNLLDPVWVDFQGPAGSYPTYSAEDISEAGAPPGTFKGKIVLIGREGSTQSDFETPFGKMSRLEIQANAIDTFLTHREIRILPHYATLIVSIAAVLISVVVILYFPLTLAWLLLLLFSLVVLLITLFILSYFKVWFGVANPIFCIFGTHLVVLGFKLSRQEEEQWRIQQESQYLKEMDQFKNNFISLFSHDLKTPIAKIKAVTERLLTDRSLNAEVKDSLRIIDRTNDELARFISDILKVTKMESMAIEPAKEVLDMNRLVEEAAHRLKFLADGKRIRLVMDLEPLFSMEGDQQLIQEVILNLIENAIKYSPPERQIIVRTREEEGRVRIAVIDEGEGIAPEELPRVTGKFYRGREMAQKTKGSGLGLYLAKYFVELHHGELDLKSELGKGTEVSFWLPIPD